MGETFNGLITHIDGEGPFIKLKIAKEPMFSNLKDQLESYTEILKCDGNRVNLQDLVPSNRLILAKFADDKWYRGNVVGLQSNMSVPVRAIDCGLTEIVAVNDIRPIHIFSGTLIEKAPPSAKQCFVSNLITDSERWDTRVLESAKKFFVMKQATFKVELESLMFAKVTLADSGKDISSIFIEKNVGKYISNSGQTQLIIRYYESKLQEPDNETAPTVASKDSNSTEYLQQTVLEVGSVHEVLVTAVINGPMLFSVTLASATHLLSDIVTHVNSQPLKSLQDLPLPGTGCLVQLTEGPNKSMGRAYIKTTGADLCEVYFVDFGTTKSVPYSQLYDLPLQCKQIKPLAIQMSHFGSEDLALIPAANFIFQQLVKDKNFKMWVAPQEGSSTIPCCTLYDTDNNSILTVLRGHLRTVADSRSPMTGSNHATQEPVHIQGSHPVCADFINSANNLTRGNNKREIPSSSVDNVPPEKRPCFEQSLASYHERMPEHSTLVHAPSQDQFQQPHVPRTVQQTGYLYRPVTADPQFPRTMECLPSSRDQYLHQESVQEVAGPRLLPSLQEQAPVSSLNIYGIGAISNEKQVGGRYVAERLPLKIEQTAFVGCREPTPAGHTGISPNLQQSMYGYRAADAGIRNIPRPMITMQTEAVSCLGPLNVPQSEHMQQLYREPDGHVLSNRVISANNINRLAVSQVEPISRRGPQDFLPASTTTPGRKQQVTDNVESPSALSQEFKPAGVDQHSGWSNSAHARCENQSYAHNNIDPNSQVHSSPYQISRDEFTTTRHGNYERLKAESTVSSTNPSLVRYCENPTTNEYDNPVSEAGKSPAKPDTVYRSTPATALLRPPQNNMLQLHQESLPWHDKSPLKRPYHSRTDEYIMEKKIKYDNNPHTNSPIKTNTDDKWGHDKFHAQESREVWGDEKIQLKSRSSDVKEEEHSNGSRFSTGFKTAGSESNDQTENKRSWEKGFTSQNKSTAGFSEANQYKPRDFPERYQKSSGLFGNSKNGRFSSPSGRFQTKFNTHSNVPKCCFKPQSISPCKDKLAVFATFMTSPSDFYVQPESSMDELQSLMDKIVQMCEAGGSAADVPSGYLDPGDACLAKYTADDLWYRAQVLSVSGDKVKVKLVDYGNVLEVDVAGQVKYASAELVELPVQGIYCRLRGATPSVGEVWGQQELLVFTAAVDNKALKLEVVALEGLRLMQYSVVLYDEQECLNSKFGASSDSLLPCNELLKCELSEGSEHNVFFSWFITPDNFHVILEDNIKERDYMYAEFAAMECPPLTQVEPGTLVLATKDNAYFRAKTIATRDTKIRVTNLDNGALRVCEFKDVRVMPESLKQTPAFAVHCGMFGILPKTEKWQLNDEKVNKLLKSIPKFVMKVKSQDNQGKAMVTLHAGEIDVAQSLVDNDVAVYINQAEEKLFPGFSSKVFISYSEGLDKIFVTEASKQDELEAMQSRLNAATLEQPATSTSDLVAVMNPDDQVWYRAAPISSTPCGAIQIFFVDYGNKANVQEIKSLPEEFSSFNHFATECRLAVRPPNGALTFSQEAIEKFESLAFDDQVQLTAKVFAKHEGRLLVDFLVNNTTSLIESLAEEKLVEPMMTEAYISVVESTTEFYVQQVKDESMIHEVEERLATEQFDDLQKVEVGMKVLARFTDDGALYRAEVTGEAEDGHGYRVHFMDYGNGSVSTDFKQLPPDLESLPALCHQCSLASVPCNDEEKSKFIQLVKDGTVKFQILKLSVEPIWLVLVLKEWKEVCATIPREAQAVTLSNICNNTMEIENKIIGIDACIVDIKCPGPVSLKEEKYISTDEYNLDHEEQNSTENVVPCIVNNEDKTSQIETECLKSVPVEDEQLISNKAESQSLTVKEIPTSTLMDNDNETEKYKNRQTETSPETMKAISDENSMVSTTINQSNSVKLQQTECNFGAAKEKLLNMEHVADTTVIIHAHALDKEVESENAADMEVTESHCKVELQICEEEKNVEDTTSVVENGDMQITVLPESISSLNNEVDETEIVQEEITNLSVQEEITNLSTETKMEASASLNDNVLEVETPKEELKSPKCHLSEAFDIVECAYVMEETAKSTQMDNEDMQVDKKLNEEDESIRSETEETIQITEEKCYQVEAKEIDINNPVVIVDEQLEHEPVHTLHCEPDLEDVGGLKENNICQVVSYTFVDMSCWQPESLNSSFETSALVANDVLLSSEVETKILVVPAMVNNDDNGVVTFKETEDDVKMISDTSNMQLLANLAVDEQLLPVCNPKDLVERQLSAIFSDVNVDTSEDQIKNTEEKTDVCAVEPEVEEETSLVSTVENENAVSDAEEEAEVEIKLELSDSSSGSDEDTET